MLDVLRGKKTEDSDNVFFLSPCSKFFANMEKLFMADLLPNGIHEKVMISSICHITKSRLDVQCVKKTPLEMVIGQQMKEEGYYQNNGFYIKLYIHLLLK